MICTSVIPCLSGVLVKDYTAMFMFVLFSRLSSRFESLAFFSKTEGQTLHQNSQRQDIFSQFFKGTTIKQKFFKKRAAILTKK